MSKYAGLLCVAILTGGSLWSASSVAYRDPSQNRKPASALPLADDALVKFEALKKRLPELTAPWCKSEWVTAPQVQFARLISPTEAKIILEAKDMYMDGKHVYVIFLQYYDGKWTTTRWEGWVSRDVQPLAGKNLLPLTRAIDESEGK